MPLRVLATLALLLGFTYLVLAQPEPLRACASAALLQRLPAGQRSLLPGGAAFEAGFAAYKRGLATARTATDTAIYTIPVVVHVVHNGEAIGVGANISDVQVRSQIRILNEDYQAMAGTRGYSADSRAGNAQIQFVLADEDPNATPSTGIQRINGGRALWSLGDNDALKSLATWTVCQYLNIWVCNLDTYLGYSTFPSTDLPFGNAQGGSYPDGVVVCYKDFGLGSVSRIYGYGRTATHEIGHYLGLIHTWGDGDCSATDFCDDTPPQSAPDQYCDSTAHQCPGYRATLVADYMNYTPDTCMHLFTHDQVLRIRYVMRNSPCRVSLRTSPAIPTGTQPVQPTPAQITFNRGADGVAYLQFHDTGAAEVRITDVLGRQLAAVAQMPDAQGRISLKAPGVAPAVYLISVKQGGSAVRVKWYAFGN